ncbi:DUF4179 domain-containing protein [Paenibacillus prosopidis]|uniref:Uncharacterized protein DUF4179 n=1 Tax=Paenibacillus prosopidis TaxID=630520 RepID=A0A368VGD5_9BACL|nr:DUF4179 domain-containing protein [Paenibacillus prosopidis]RCW40340.1 uncharacterized protein DUF4179 [Paenibacillus prosopidis]
MNELERDLLIRDALLDETSTMPKLVREKMDFVYSNLPKRRSNSRVRKVAWQIAVVMIAMIVGIFSLGLVSPVMANYLSHLPVIGSAFKTAGDVGLKIAGDELSSSFVRQTVEDKGVSITLDQIVYDGTRISIGFLHDSNLQLSMDPLMIHIKGEPISSGLGGVSKEVIDGTMATVLRFSVEKTLPDKFTLSIRIDEVAISQDGKVEKLHGDWSFNAEVVKITDGLIEQTFDPPLIRSIDNIKIAVRNITISPLTTKVAFDLERPVELDPSNIHSENRREGEVTVMRDLKFKLFDSEGNQLETLSMHISKNADGPEHCIVLFAPLTGKHQELILRTFLESTKVKKDRESSYSSVDLPEIQHLTEMDVNIFMK